MWDTEAGPSTEHAIGRGLRQLMTKVQNAARENRLCWAAGGYGGKVGVPSGSLPLGMGSRTPEDTVRGMLTRYDKALDRNPLVEVGCRMERQKI